MRSAGVDAPAVNTVAGYRSAWASSIRAVSPPASPQEWNVPTTSGPRRRFGASSGCSVAVAEQVQRAGGVPARGLGRVARRVAARGGGRLLGGQRAERRAHRALHVGRFGEVDRGDAIDVRPIEDERHALVLAHRVEDAAHLTGQVRTEVAVADLAADPPEVGGGTGLDGHAVRAGGADQDGVELLVADRTHE